MRHKRPISLFAALCMLIIALAACTTMPPTGPASNTTARPIGQDTDLDTFSSEQEFVDFVAQYSDGGYYSYYAMARSAVFDMDAAVSAVAPTSVGASAIAKEAIEAYSQTNNQVGGVDEADILKTDGEYIYTLTEDTLFIIKANPAADAQVVAALQFEDTPQGIFIKDDRLAIFGSDYNHVFRGYPSLDPVMSYVHLYDISDRTVPELLTNFSFEGYYFDARLIDEHIYFVTQSHPDNRDVYPMPLIVQDEKISTVPVDRIAIYPVPYDNPVFVNAHSITMDGKLTDSQTVTVENAQDMYMSATDLFIVGSEYVNEWKMEQDLIKQQASDLLTADDEDLIEEIEDVSSKILSRGEKENKIMNVYYTAIGRLSDDEEEDFYERVRDALDAKLDLIDYFQYTTITQLSAQDGNVDVQATGKVPGRIVNQFSLDQHDDHLRIATTIDARWDNQGKETQDSTTNIWVLDEDLEEVGSLKGLAPTEQIYSTRFIGDRLYLVTFKQVDPFFVIDLSDPQEPRSLGELKIPGFSRYLHPYDEDHIIGIGQDTDSRGRTTGLKISLFNVENVAKPIEVATYVTEEKYASSTALYEHKAFLFDREKNLLVIPAYSYDYWSDRDEYSYNGAFVFDIDEDDIKLRGLIDHSRKQQDDYYWYGPSVERSLYIGNVLYTKSPYLLRANDLDDLSSISNVTLTIERESDLPIY